MANMNIRTPEFYPDKIKQLRTRGGGGVASIITGTDLIDFQTGNIASLHNGKPLDLCTFDTTGDQDGHVLFNYNLGSSTFRTTYIAVLNHNLNSCNGKIRVFVGSTATSIDDVNGTNAEGNAFGDFSVLQIVNCGDIDIGGSGSDRKSIHVHPSNNGTTIFKIVHGTDGSDFTGFRYIGVQIEGDDSNSDTGSNGNFDGTTDLSIGCIEIGESYKMPFSPDLNVKRSIIYDNTKIQESLGGQRYANATSFGRTSTLTSKSPFSLADYAQYGNNGRITYEMSFSYLQNTDLMPTEYGEMDNANDSFVTDVWSVTEGNFHPFIFSIDSESTSMNTEASSEFIYARFAQNSLEMEQVANDIFTIKLEIEEDF